MNGGLQSKTSSVMSLPKVSFSRVQQDGRPSGSLDRHLACLINTFVSSSRSTPFRHALTAVGSVYSAYEATTLLRPAASDAGNRINEDKTKIPLDITIQTLLSTSLLLACTIFSSPPLRPIRWNEWAGRIEREGWDPAFHTDISGEPAGKRQIGGAGNPYRMLEERRGFWDVRGSRAEFASLIREGGGVARKTSG